MAVQFPSSQSTSVSLADLFRRAVGHHGSGQLDEALRLYTRLLDANFQAFKVSELAGIASMQLGDYRLAVSYFRLARSCQPINHSILNNLGVSLKNIDQLNEAAASLRLAIELAPNYAEAHNNLGAVLEQRGEVLRAAEAFLATLKLNARHAGALSNLKRVIQHPSIAENLVDELEAMAHADLENLALREISSIARSLSGARHSSAPQEHSFQEPDGPRLERLVKLAVAKTALGEHKVAIQVYREALASDPANANLWLNLGVLYRVEGDHREAMACFQQAVELAPGSAMAWNNLATVHLDLADLANAKATLERALHLDPSLANVHGNLGMLYRTLEAPDLAISHYQRALNLDANLYEAHFNLGNLRAELGDETGAFTAFSRAVELAPGDPAAHYSLGLAESNPARAVNSLNRAIALRPDYAEAEVARAYHQLKACDWTDLQPRLARAHEIATEPSMPAISPFWFLALSNSRKAQQLCARKWVAKKLISDASAFTVAREKTVRKDAAIKVGLLSGDLREHAVGELLRDVLPRVNSTTCELWAYDASPEESSATRHALLSACKTVRSIATQSSTQLANQIKADEIDVLVDLSGFTQHSRSRVLGLRPAPVQISYLGFPGTMGWKSVDYLVADDFLVPALHESDYDERIVRLPHCYQPGRQYPIQGLTMPTRQSVGLPQDGFVFACFNNPYKLRPEVFECWLRILENTPGSVLWMASFNDAAQSNLCALARNRGVDTSRLVFAPIVKTEAHVARLHLADLYLDTTPYGAGITAAQTLFSGVPLLTIAGETYVGRMAASMLHALRLDPLIADSLPDYEARALRLAHDSQALRQLRERLRLAKELSPVFDPGKSAENLTQLFLRLVKCKPAPALLKDHSEYA